MDAPPGEFISVARPRFVPPALTRPSPRHVPRAVRWFGATLGTAIVVGGLTLWLLRATPPLPSAPPDVTGASSPVAESAPLIGVESLGPDTSTPVLPNLAPPGETAPDWRAEGPPVEAAPRAPAPSDPAVVADDELATEAGMVDGTADVAADPRCTEGAGAGIGTIAVNTRPWSDVTLDGVLVGSTPQILIATCAGTHELTLENRAFGLHESRPVTVVAGETLRLMITLPPGSGGATVPPAPPWTVEFTSDPPGAAVRIVRRDESLTLCTTPCTAEIPRGGLPWQVEVTRAGFEPSSAPLGRPPDDGPGTHTARLRAVCAEGDVACVDARDAELANTPSRGELVRVMGGVQAEVAACGRTYGHGTLHVHLTIAGSTGRVVEATVSGELATDAGECVLAAAREVMTPRFRQEFFRVTYPLRL